MILIVSVGSIKSNVSFNLVKASSFERSDKSTLKTDTRLIIFWLFMLMTAKKKIKIILML